MNKLVNFIAFQTIWFIAVFGAANNLIWPTGIALCTFMIWQLSPARRHPNDIRFIMLALITGITLDSAWQLFGYIQFNEPFPYFSHISPLWILSLWIAFALTFNHSLAWLKNSPLLAITFGFIGAPLSYYAGVKLGALTYPQGLTTISLLIGVTWSAVIYFFTQYQHIFSHTHSKA